MAESTEGSELAVPGVIYVGKHGGNSGKSLVRLGPAAGWIAPRGIRAWEREISVVARGALTEPIRKDLGLTMPDEQIPAAKMPITAQAAKSSPLVAVARGLVDKLVAKNVRVHTVGFDRISGGFYYFAEGGGAEAVRVQVDLMEMIAGALGDSADNAALEKSLDDIIDRLLVELSNGAISEASVELAEALPRATADGTGLEDVDLEAFEKEASRLVGRSEKWQQGAKKLAEKLGATKDGEVVKVPLFGEARKETQAALSVQVGGATKKLASRGLWTVSGAPREIKEEAPPAAKPQPAPSPKPAPTAKPVEAKPAAKVEPKKETSPAPKKVEEKKPAIATTVAATPSAKAAEPKKEAAPKPVEKKPEEKKPAAAAEAKPAEKAPEKKAEPAKAEPKPEAKAAEPKVEKAEKAEKAAEKAETKAEAKSAGKTEKTEKKAEAKAEKKAEAKVAASEKKTVSEKKPVKAAAVDEADEDEKAIEKPEQGSSFWTIAIVVGLAIAAFLVWRLMHH